MQKGRVTLDNRAGFMVPFSCHEGRGPEDVPKGGTMFYVQTYRRPTACAVWFDVVDCRSFTTKADAMEAGRLVTAMMWETDHDMWSVDVMDDEGRVLYTWGAIVWGK